MHDNTAEDSAPVCLLAWCRIWGRHLQSVCTVLRTVWHIAFLDMRTFVLVRTLRTPWCPFGAA